MKKARTFIQITAVVAIVSLVLLSFTKRDANFVKGADMVKDWERAKAYTKEYLDAASNETIGYKPTPEMRSFAQQMLHIAEANYGLGSAASGKPNPINWGQLEKAPEKYNTKETLTTAVMDSYDFVINALKATDDSKMSESVKIFNFDMTREAAFQKTFEHQTHHRGQTTVYLRLSKVTPPQEKLF
jgi:uncharacterized damage-inducible protein DinB